MTSALRQLDEGRALTRNQKIVLAVAMMNGALEFFDQFIIAFVLAFMIKVWHLTYGQSAVVLLSSGSARSRAPNICGMSSTAGAGGSR